MTTPTTLSHHWVWVDIVEYTSTHTQEVVMATASAAASTRSAAEVADAHRELQSRLEQSELRADASDGKAKVANTRYLA